MRGVVPWVFSSVATPTVMLDTNGKRSDGKEVRGLNVRVRSHSSPPRRREQLARTGRLLHFLETR